MKKVLLYTLNVWKENSNSYEGKLSSTNNELYSKTRHRALSLIAGGWKRGSPSDHVVSWVGKQ